MNHILTDCPKALGEGKYRWRHVKVLTEIAKWTGWQRVKANKHQASPLKAVKFGKKEDKVSKESTAAKNMRSILQQASDWEMQVDLQKKLVFLEEVAVMSLRPNMILLSRSKKTILVAKLTVPWEEESQIPRLG